jgi:protein-S-isoprenylcysteine O-methyltransferase Ste14
VRVLFWCVTLGGLAYFVPGFYRGGGEYAARCPRMLAIRLAEALAIVIYVAVLAAGRDFAWAPFPEATAPAGLVLATSGAGLVVWSRRRLQSNFTVTLGVKQDHELVAWGPYAWIRHPMYTGFLLQFAGGALLYNSGITLILLFLPFAAFFWWQSVEEEKLLLDHFGERYRRYRETTGRLLPRLGKGT